MSEKRYFKIEYDEEWYLFDSATISEQLVKEQAEYGYGVFANSLSPSEVVDLLNKLYEENEQLKKKIKPSIYNKKDGDWKWNVDNNTILNIRTGEIFYLRNSGAVENLVHLLNKLEQILSENEKMLQKDLDMLTELRRENEQLKKQLELRTESDKYHQRMLLKWLCIDEDEE